jgi:hypothetical protein
VKIIAEWSVLYPGIILVYFISEYRSSETISEYYLSGDVEDHLNVRFKCNDQTFFEILKMKIRSITITYTQILAL